MRQQVIISLSDIWQAIRRNSLLILLFALLVGTVAFIHQLKKPIHYTADGYFKCGVNQPSVSKVLELLGAGEQYSPTDDPNFFLTSYPVMARVAQSLNLQAMTYDGRKESRIKQLWYTFKAEQWKKRPLNSPLSSHKIASSLNFPDKRPSLNCINVEFQGEKPQQLSVTFLNEKEFIVKQGKKSIGRGELNHPFIWEEGAFTLSSDQRLKKKHFSITLIPLEMIIDSLQKMIRVEKDKKNRVLIHVSFTHPDRNFAAKVVNSAMIEFQNYLKSEGRKKISKQLEYLEERQNRTFENFESIMQNHRSFLEKNLDSGELLSLEKEIELLSKDLSEVRSKLRHVSQEIEQLEEENLPPVDHLESTTIESSRTLLLQYEEELEQVAFELQNYGDAIKKLGEPDFDSSSLSKILNDPIHFEKIHRLNRQLSDEKNWTAKERIQLKEELELEKNFLSKHISHLKDGGEIKKERLTQKIHAIKATLLLLLRDTQSSLERKLQQLNQKAAQFPEKWLNKQKIELNTKISVDMMESITKLIEAKNISFHLDYLNSTPLKMAATPVLPDLPHLRLGFFVGFIGSIFLALCFLSLREIWLSPTASFSNLQSAGYRVYSSVDHLIHSPLGDVISIISKKEKHQELVSALEAIGKQVIASKHFIKNVDTSIYYVTDERFSDLPSLPKETLFIANSHSRIPLTQVRPFLEKLLQKVSSSPSKI